MGLTTAGRIAGRLIAAGRAPSTPVAIVESASLSHERRRVSTLAELEATVADLDGPALLIVGEVAALADVAGLAGEGVASPDESFIREFKS